MRIDLDDWNKLPTQEQVYYDDKSEIVIQASGLGGGKTHVLCRKVLKYTAYNNKFPGGILAPTYSDYRKDIEPEMFNILEDKLELQENKHFWYNRSQKEWRFIWNKNPTYIFTGEKPIAGPNLAWCAINEFSLIKYDRINEMTRRVRLKDVPLKQRLLVGTPEDTHGWLQDYVENMSKSYGDKFKIYNSDTKENIHIDEHYRKYLENTLDNYQLQVFAEGKFNAIRPDSVYYMFSDNNISDFTASPKGRIFIGMDFNVNPMTAIACYVDNNTIYVFKEWFLKNSNTYEMAVELKDFLHNKEHSIIPDATGRALKTSSAKISDHDILRRNGLRVEGVHNPYVKDRYNCVNGLLDHKRIVIHKDCKMLIRDMQRLRHDNKDEMLSHISDCLGYVCWWLFPLRMERKSLSIQL